MFSLIITLISIALVAALALASLYYGGPVFNQGAARAKVAQIQNAFQQLSGANELYKADTGAYAQSLNELVAQQYLKSIPVAQADQGLLGSAYAADSFSFSMVAPGINTFAASMVSVDICKEVNKQAFGVEGVLAAPHALDSVTIQCYGPDADHLVVIQGKAPSDLIALSTMPGTSVPITTVSTAPVPAASVTGTSDGWTVLSTSTTPVTPPTPAPSSLTLALSIPVDTYSVTPLYSSATDSLTYVANAPGSTTLNSITYSGVSTTYPGDAYEPMAVDKVSGQIYATNGQDFQTWNSVNQSWYVLSSPNCSLLGVFATNAFANCNGVLTALNRLTGTQSQTDYSYVPLLSYGNLVGQNQSLDTLMDVNWGDSSVMLFNVNTGIVQHKALPVTGKVFLTQSNRIFVQDGGNDFYQVVNGAAVKIAGVENITGAGCNYYHGAIASVFERANGDLNLACGYGPEDYASTTNATQILKFTPAQ